MLIRPALWRKLLVKPSADGGLTFHFRSHLNTPVQMLQLTLESRERLACMTAKLRTSHVGYHDTHTVLTPMRILQRTLGKDVEDNSWLTKTGPSMRDTNQAEGIDV